MVSTTRRAWEIRFELTPPIDVAKILALRVREARLEKNWSQKALADKSGVRLGTLKKFEATGEISLERLLFLALALDMTEPFAHLFLPHYRSLDEVIATLDKVGRRRGRSA